VICLCSGSSSWGRQFQALQVYCHAARSGSRLLLFYPLTPFHVTASESQTLTAQGGETWHLRQRCWDAMQSHCWGGGSTAAPGEEAKSDWLFKINASFLWVCAYLSFDVFCMLLMLEYMWLLLIFSSCLHCSFSSHNWVSVSALVWSTVTAPHNLCLPLFLTEKIMSSAD